ncbi:hypothetical protein COPG_00124 [Colwellia phage 9A]|uniref:Uncharacterized protein n=1 Tax=Colwellia phage 9A TaxID=765765 RepID=I3UMK5_9CAUD|nr:hypothetical protein COPG_00124 [Colwellia phage 9A]AFK66720.1 hypothetical protein COPG_00124 [Colwellia phage 9A]
MTRYIKLSRQYWSGTDVTSVMSWENDVLVFGSNPEGRHGLGLAKTAIRYFGAKYGKGRGLCGNSYALVTKNLRKNFVEVLADGTELRYTSDGYASVKVRWIADNIREMLEVCKANPDRRFFFPYTRDANNLNGISSSRLISTLMNSGIPDNLVISDTFKSRVEQ